MHLLDIAEVARISGLSASALRYYEEKGLIASAGRRGLRRQFEPAVLDVLDAIGLARWAGFSLDEVRCWIAGDGTIRPDRESLAARAGDIEALAARLTALAQMVRHTADCPAADHFACPQFQRMLKVARRHHAPPGKIAAGAKGRGGRG